MGSAISVSGLKKSFSARPVYDGFDLEVRPGEILSIFGPNGCGKSTLINIIAGLLPHDDGKILFAGRPIGAIRLGYVFQNYREALFPWKTAADNIRYPLRRLNFPRSQIIARLAELQDLFSVRFDLSRYPYELSGGQQQLVSIMRALAIDPEVLFLDEPFSALDYETTLALRELLQKVLKQIGVTTLLVSHDLEEAIVLADRMLLLTRRPTRIADDVAINLPWPRSPSTLSASAFVEIKRRCLESFASATQP
jgi:NitT/TauT family transport system ATP-binding protein